MTTILLGFQQRDVIAVVESGSVWRSIRLLFNVRFFRYFSNFQLSTTIVSISRVGLQLDEFYRRLLPQTYMVTRTFCLTEHYECMVDLFGRVGLVEKAFGMIRSMSFGQDGPCHLHGNAELIKMAFEHLLSLNLQNSTYYMLQSNIHANAGKWDMVSKICHMMKERGAQKVPGYSWSEVNNSTDML
ncbi:hypothetical protein CQW23_26505 [Capsicum baccatum]|uniref:Pentatricopeptide repeat-containing protein n=1 Tax=Capsicum baccatum TaxID=33114 RepID=A0A2G2VNZ6_CAPBA|nr:hypothetical protein CQW23_26505 [Capsicum baccatum]